MSTSSTTADWRRQANLSRVVSRLFSRSIASRSIVIAMRSSKAKAAMSGCRRCSSKCFGHAGEPECEQAVVGGMGQHIFSSVVVTSPSDVGVPDRLAFRAILLREGLIEPMLQDRDDGAVARRADIVAATSGRFEPLRAVALL